MSLKENEPETHRQAGHIGECIIAGGFYGHGPDLVDSSRQFRRIVEKL